MRIQRALLRCGRSLRSLGYDHAAEKHTIHVSGLTEKQTERAMQRDNDIRKQHLAAPTASESISVEEATKKRLLYRSRQRGWLEVDLLLGSFAQKHIQQLSKEELDQYEAILNQETIDIFNYISKQLPVPEDLNTPMMHKLQAYCASSPLGKASMHGYLKNKQFMSN